MGNRFTRTAPIKNEIDIEKQEQQIQKTVEEEAQEMKIMIYSPAAVKLVKEEKVDDFGEEANSIQIAQNGIEEGQNGTMNGEKGTKEMMEMDKLENGHNSVAGPSSSEINSTTKKNGQNGQIFEQLATDKKSENANNGKMARPQPQQRLVANPPKRQIKKEMAASGRRRGRPSSKFTGHQIKMLENKFKTTQYLAVLDRVRIATNLELTEKQVKIWFANRRQQQKKRDRKINRANNDNKRADAWQMDEEEDEAEEEEQAEMEGE